MLAPAEHGHDGAVAELSSHPARVHVVRVGGFLVALVLFVVVGALAVLLGFIMVMASDTCGLDDDRVICSVRGQQLVAALPVTAFSVGLVILMVGGVLALKRGRPVLRWVLVSWALLVTGTVTAFLIATASPNPQSAAGSDVPRAGPPIAVGQSCVCAI